MLDCTCFPTRNCVAGGATHQSIALGAATSLQHTHFGMRARSKRLAGPPDARRAELSCGSRKVGLTRIGDEGEELAEFLTGLEGIAAQVINRADWARTRGLPG
jgi:hypothetical protein